jgi:hypothetical protein
MLPHTVRALIVTAARNALNQACDNLAANPLASQTDFDIEFDVSVCPNKGEIVAVARIQYGSEVLTASRLCFPE